MSKYENYSPEQLKEHFSKFLVNSWSYSSVSQFARNEKAFERSYIYGEKEASSASAISGNAYHTALEFFFRELMEGREAPDVITLRQKAYEFIDSIPDSAWKIQKTNPTVEAARTTATENATTLIDNFLSESRVYLAELDKVLHVEEKWECWLDINGVDIPLPCHMRVDVVFRLKDGRTVIVDHKSVTSYTDITALTMTRGKQAITYFKGYEKMTGCKADEIWFIENKISRNSTGEMQLRKFALQIDEDSQRLYEAMLYEPLRRLVQAVNDPDYVYTVNDSDSFTDKAEIYNFWTRTMIAEVSEFPGIREDKRDLISKRLKKVRDSSLAMVNPKVITAFQKTAKAFIPLDYSKTNMTRAEKIEHVLRSLGVSVQVKHEIEGYSSDTFLLEAAAGVKLGTVLKYDMDVANALGVSNVRINRSLVVHEGRSYLSIEANKPRTKDLLWDKRYLTDRKIPLGFDNYDNMVIWDLDNHSTPHMLTCGATGSGKSVLIRSTIAYAEDCVDRIIVMDPKNEFGALAGGNIEVFDDIADIEAEMKRLVEEMQSSKGAYMGHTLIIFDEFADAVQSARSGKELDIKEDEVTGYKKDGTPIIKQRVVGREKSLEENLRMLLQKGRSLGYRVLAATQRASTKVITGDSKVNFPVQVCFRVPKQVDSKVVIDEAGAETLTGKGDALIKSPEYLDRLVRFQGFFYKEEQ